LAKKQSPIGRKFAQSRHPARGEDKKETRKVVIIFSRLFCQTTGQLKYPIIDEQVENKIIGVPKKQSAMKKASVLKRDMLRQKNCDN
jgi:hypothetical protein